MSAAGKAMHGNSQSAEAKQKAPDSSSRLGRLAVFKVRDLLTVEGYECMRGNVADVLLKRGTHRLCAASLRGMHVDQDLT